MAEQIFISYRREGGDVTAKLICEALKNRGFTVFYDYDSLEGGYFDARILTAIEECDDVVLVLPPNSLDRCMNDDDWVRIEIRHALDCEKNIIPILLPEFSFPKDLPDDIKKIRNADGVQFFMPYFDAVMDAVVCRLKAKAIIVDKPEDETKSKVRGALEYTLKGNGYSVSAGNCNDSEVIIPASYQDKPVTSIKDKAFKDCSGITSVVIPESVTAIGSHAFAYCHSLESVTLPNSVTSIGDCAFVFCPSLTSITLPVSVTNIGYGAFQMCDSLKTMKYEGTVREWKKISLGESWRPENIKEIICSNGKCKV